MSKKKIDYDFGILPRQPLQFIMEQVTWLKHRLNRASDKWVRDGEQRSTGVKRASHDRIGHSTGQSYAHEIVERIQKQRKKELQNIRKNRHREHEQER